MLKKKILTGALTAVLLLTSGISVALADTNLEGRGFQILGTSWEDYDLTVPGNNVNDSRGETSSQTKVTSGALAGLRVNSTGGEELDVRTESSSGNGSWKYGVEGGNTYSLNSPQLTGDTLWLQFSTGLFQGPVTTTGEWRSN
ncbi:hypothetical protein FHR92_003780 [Fontibacillus solani]|uniref:Uncharacterized protein n=1 Tax=Fontibacillus solani TaxID=1572857 RepID=A0A7W3SW10_9BACL|nr:hypothetical protein [Fontibacillus solani]MBA9087296.1 hypothetical protein [Fontibacillus solani]